MTAHTRRAQHALEAPLPMAVPDLVGLAASAKQGKVPVSCRANSRRGSTDAARPSYPPVESVRRALEILRVLNRLKIASISDLYAATELPKPTIVRMLETLIADGYVARDNMCGGYRVTARVRELDAGYEGISRVIEASRPLAIDLTQRIKWPVGIGVPDGDAFAVQFWTGTISPWAHLNTLLGHRPPLRTSAMGRAYLAFCPEEERERLISMIRARPDTSFGADEEAQFRRLLDRVRADGFAVRAPQTEPRRNTTIGMPIRYDGVVLASITVSFFTTAVPKDEIAERIIEPLRVTVRKIEETIRFMHVTEVNAEHRHLVLGSGAGQSQGGGELTMHVSGL